MGSARGCRRTWRNVRGSLLLVLALAAGGIVAHTLVAAAADPQHVTFRLEGCRLPGGTTLPDATGAFVCADGAYTTGNLGKNYSELDLVPHRLTASTGIAQTYTIAVAADAVEAGTPGYDVISKPVVNARLTQGSCSVTSGDQKTLTPGAGGTDSSIYRLATITQGAGSTCVLDYYERLALGAAGFPGSSLHSNLLNEDLQTAGVGARDVPLPVNAIRPQQLGKTMTATRGSTVAWNVAKDAAPADLSFETCSTAQNARAQKVTITLRWTKTQVSANAVTLVSNITITNTARRALRVTVTDKMFAATGAGAQVGTTYTSPPTLVGAQASVTLTNTQTTTPGPARFRDVATATYDDPVTGVPIPGTTTATAEATVENVSNVPNATATISDSESITGNGLSFSLDATAPAATGSLGGGNYALGTPTTGPLTWTHAVSASGQIVFEKTVRVAGELNTTGTLSDVATLTDAAGTSRTASATTTIDARACIRGEKFDDANVSGSKDAGEPGVGGVTVYLDLDDDGALDPGEPSAVTDATGAFAISTAAVADGTYKLREVVPAGQACTYPSPCFHTVVVGPGAAPTGLRFGNHGAPPTRGSSEPSGPPPPPPAPPRVALPPTAKLFVPALCVSRRMHVFVAGRRIARVRFYVDGALAATVTRADRLGRFRARIEVSRLRPASRHRIVARIQFEPSTGVRQRTQSLQFRLCGRAGRQANPPFTG